MGRWRDIMDQIKVCRLEPDVVACLRTLFDQTQDGMVALALGEELEGRGQLREALGAYKDAERLFPRPEWKQRAREGADRVSRKLLTEGAADTTETSAGSEGDRRNTLFVVSCTRRKIWSQEPMARTFVAAKDAYIGGMMRSWLKSELCQPETRWLILSAKYGFIEPDHPVSDYDVTFENDNTGPITLDSLRAQVEHQCRWHGPDKRRLADFSDVRVWGSELYFKVASVAFTGTGARVTRLPESGKQE